MKKSLFVGVVLAQFLVVPVAMSGEYCREFTQEFIIGNHKERGYGTACQQADGSWQIQTPARFAAAEPVYIPQYIEREQPVYIREPYYGRRSCHREPAFRVSFGSDRGRGWDRGRGYGDDYGRGRGYGRGGHW